MPFDVVSAPLMRLRVEGYASLFGLEDLNGDVVHPGAFRDSLKARANAPLPMLLDHSAEPIGDWSYVAEDSRGLFVRGAVTNETKRGHRAVALLQSGAMDGLSIGFIAKRARARPARGRDLFEIDLWEVSIVGTPMAPQARLRVVRGVF